jgi:chromosome segregation ATPase
MRTFLSTSGVIQTILNFDARNVTPKLKEKVYKIIKQAPNSFEQPVIMNASRAAAPLAAWCVSQVKYSEVLLKIEPLTSELDGLLERLQISQQRVHECEEQLNQLSLQTEKLNNDYQQKTKEAAILENDLKQAENTLNSA